MSADARNTTILIGGIVAEPEIKADGKLIVFRLAVDYAGNDSANPENKTGYFNVKYFANESPNSKFVFAQVQDGKMTKGSQGIAVMGRLQHERWESDGNKRDGVAVMAENITYAGGGKPATDKADTAAGTTDNVPGW